MEQANGRTIAFRCPPELEKILPRPIAAISGLPEWFKAMPQSAFSAVMQDEARTVKKCPPFIDAMTHGFLIPLVADLRVEGGVFTWDWEIPSEALTSYPRSPIDFHDGAQVAGSPFFQEDRFVIKFTNFWTIELPQDYSLLITHPFNRRDLPFQTLTGLVDADRYHDNFVYFPALWTDPGFHGVLARGTPVAQCVPIRREIWSANFGRIEGEAAERLHETATAISGGHDVYRREFRAPKR